MKRRGISWFVEPFGADTNKAISDQLKAMSLVDESSSELAHTYRGEKINTWRVDRKFALDLLNSRKSLGLKFRIFYRKDPDGKLILWKGSSIIYKDKPMRIVMNKGELINSEEAIVIRCFLNMLEELKKYQSTRRLADDNGSAKVMKEVSRLSKLITPAADSLNKLFLRKTKKR